MRSDKPGPRTAEDTLRQRASRACRRHLEDLRRAHKNPPADLVIKSSGAPRFLEPTALSSYRTSPAELCSELGE